MSNLIFTFKDGSEYLCHYGVLGMKWGVRKDRVKTGKKKRSRQHMIGGDQRLVKFGRSYGKAYHEINNYYNKSDKIDVSSVKEFRKLSKNDADTYKSLSKLYPKGSKRQKFWENAYLETLGEVSAMDRWLGETHVKAVVNK